MKLAIKDLSKVLVKDIENVLSTSQKTNIISITNDISVGVGENVLCGHAFGEINLATKAMAQDIF